MPPTEYSEAELVDSYAQHVGSRQVTPETIHRHLFCPGIVLDHFRDRISRAGWKSVTVDDVRAFVIAYAQGHGVDSRRHLHTTLRSFLRFAHQWQLTGRDLSAAIPGIRLYQFSRAPRPIGDAAIAALLGSPDRDTAAGSRDFAIVQLLRIHGVRAVQLRHLRVTDLDWHADTIRFPAAKQGTAVIAPVLPEAGNALCEYLRRFRPSSGVPPELFLTVTGVPRALAGSTISAMIQHRVQPAGIALGPQVKAGTQPTWSASSSIRSKPPTPSPPATSASAPSAPSSTTWPGSTPTW